MIEFNDIKSAMRFINNADQELVARYNKLYDKDGELVAIVNIPKKK